MPIDRKGSVPSSRGGAVPVGSRKPYDRNTSNSVEKLATQLAVIQTHQASASILPMSLSDLLEKV